MPTPQAIVPRLGPVELTFTFAEILAGANGSATATLRGAVPGMQVFLSWETALDAGVAPQRIYVSAVDTISATLDNPTAGNITPGAKVALVSCL